MRTPILKSDYFHDGLFYFAALLLISVAYNFLEAKLLGKHNTMTSTENIQIKFTTQLLNPKHKY